MITKEKSPMRVLFLRDHEISGLGPAGADPLTVGVRAAGRVGPGRTARWGIWCRAGGRGACPGPGASTIWPPDTAAALSLSRSAGTAKDLSAANPVGHTTRRPGGLPGPGSPRPAHALHRLQTDEGTWPARLRAPGDIVDRKARRILSVVATVPCSEVRCGEDGASGAAA